jgi:hypothetical protein
MASLGLVPISRPHEASDNQVYQAWAEYTGVPEAVTGGVGFIGANAMMQGLQAKGTMRLGLPGYPTTFGAAFKMEFVMGTIIMATVLTIVDPQHKIEGAGVDETRFYKEHLEGTWTGLKGFGMDVAMAEVMPGRSLF